MIMRGNIAQCACVSGYMRIITLDVDFFFHIIRLFVD